MANTRRVKRTSVQRDEDLAVDYARYSSEQQGTIVEQHGTNNDVAEDENVQIVKSFSDAGVSRSIQDRLGLQEMFDYLEAHPEVGFVIVNELERLTAGINQRAIITEMCQRLNITILTEDMGRIDPFDQEKMQEADERAVKAKGEVLKISRRTRRTLKQRVKGGTVAMRPAYGTQMKPLVGPDGNPLPRGVHLLDEKGRRIRSGVLEIHSTEIAWLRKIFELADLDWRDETIAQFLTAQGVKTKSGSTTWRANTVAGILTNSLYKGEMVWGRQAVRRYADGTTYLEVRSEGDPSRITKTSPLGPLVEVAQWERINARRADRLGERRMNRRTNPPRVFDHRVFCLDCGRKLYGRFDNDPAAVKNPRKAPNFRYSCSSGRRPRTQVEGFAPACNPGHTITERQILASIATYGLESASTAGVYHERPTSLMNTRRQALLKEIRVAEARFQRAKDLYEEGDISKAELAEKREKRDLVRDAAQARFDLIVTENAPFIPPAEDPRADVNFQGLVELLSDETLPIELRIEALSSGGISRLYVHNPVVKIDFIQRHPSKEGSLLRPEDGSGSMDLT